MIRWTANVKYLLIMGVLLFCAPSAKAQKLRIPSDSYGFCFRLAAPGNQAISASCTVTVYLAGTTNLATIYSNTSGGAQGNPFASNTNGTWAFYGTPNVSYDVRISGGNPAMTPYTISNVQTSGSGTSSFSSGDLAPLFTTSVTNPTTTPALAFSLSNAAANTVLGRCTGTVGAPSYCNLVNAMMPAPGSTGQSIYNCAGLFCGAAGMTWDNTLRRMSLVNGANNAWFSFQPGTISFASAGGTTPPRISTVFSEFDFIGGSTDDIVIGQTGNDQHFVLPGSDFGLAKLGAGASSGALQLNDGSSGSGVFQGPKVISAVANPETNTVARIGSLYLRAGGAATTSLYVKEAGTGNTGWQQVAMQDDTQTITNKAFTDTTTTIVNTAIPSKVAKFDVSGITVATTRTFALPDANGTLCVTTTCASLYNSTGTIQALPHLVIGACTLGTDCAVTLTGASIYTSSTSYTCSAQDQTAAAATKVVQASGSGFTITGTGTDAIRYQCSGN